MKSITLAATLAATLMLAPHSARAERAPELPVKAFAQLPQVSSVNFSPDGNSMMMVRPLNGKRHIVVQETTSGKTLSVIPPMDKYEISEAHWANNNRILVVFKYQTYRGNTPTSETRLLGFDKDGQNGKYLVKPKLKGSTGSRVRASEYLPTPQFQHDIIHFLPDDPDNILLSIDGDADGEDEVRLLDVNTGNFKEVQQDRRGIQVWLADHQGRVRYGRGVDTGSALGASGTRTYKYTYNSVEGGAINIENTDIFQKGYRFLGFAANPNHAYMYGTSPFSTDHVILYDLAKNTILETVFEHEKFDAIALATDPSSGMPIGVKYFNNGVKTKFFNAEWENRMKTVNAALKNTANTIVSSTADHRMHLIHASSAEDPGMYYVYHEKRKQISPVIEVFPGLAPEHMGTVKAVNYEARDGLRIPAILTLPRGVEAKGLPTIIMPHGGPHSRSTLSYHYRAQFLANRGYAVLQPNFRGSTGYGDTFYEAGKQQWGLAMQDDVTDGTKWLVDQGIADPSRICIVGASYGGYAALMGSVKEPDLYKCAISINGVSDIPHMLQSQRKYIGGTAMTQHINQEGQSDVSPARNAKKVKAKVMLIAAKDDRVVDIKQSKLMRDALKKSKNKALYVEIEQGGHGLDTMPSRITVLTELEAFLKKHIGN